MQPLAGNDLVTLALSFAVQRLIHCSLGKASGTIVFLHLTKTSAKVWRAEAGISEV